MVGLGIWSYLTKNNNTCEILLIYYLGKRHISILSTRSVIWTLGGEGGGVAPVTFLGKKSWKISIV